MLSIHPSIPFSILHWGSWWCLSQLSQGESGHIGQLASSSPDNYVVNILIFLSRKKLSWMILKPQLYCQIKLNQYECFQGFIPMKWCSLGVYFGISCVSCTQLSEGNRKTGLNGWNGDIKWESKHQHNEEHNVRETRPTRIQSASSMELTCLLASLACRLE